MSKKENVINNKKLVLELLEQVGRCTKEEIEKHTILNKQDAAAATHRLVQDQDIYLKDGYYYPTSARLTSFVTQRLWNRFLFKGVAL